MYKKKCFFFLVALLLAIDTASARNNFADHPADAAYLIHLDKSFYVNGEVIWYKLLLPANQQHEGIAVKAVLTDKNGKTLYYTFLKNTAGYFVAGYYKIPFDLPSNIYRLSFLASDAQSGKTYTLAYANLPIYNDGEPIDENLIRNDNVFPPAAAITDDSNDLTVRIDLSTDTIRSRDQMRATITAADANGNPVEALVSLAVSDLELAAPGKRKLPNVVAGLPAPLDQPLDTNITFKAGLTNYLNQPLTANVLGVLTPQQNRIVYTRTSAPGKVNLKLPDFYGEQPIQFLGFQQEEDSIRINLLPDEGLAAEGELIYSPDIVKYLELSRQRKKIFQLYSDLEFNLHPEVPKGNIQELKPERTINVKDYEPFDNVFLFFKEILTPLVFRQVANEVYEAKIYTDRGNRVYEMLSGAPLFIIDGQATRDGNYVAHMKMDMVETIQIFTDRSELRRQFNVMGSSGVVIIETSSSDITVPDADADDIKLVHGLQAPATFPAYDFTGTGADRHRPFFRPQLYWTPDLKTDADGRAAASFFQSDARGDFLVKVLVQDSRGRTGYAEKIYYATW